MYFLIVVLCVSIFKGTSLVEVPPAWPGYSLREYFCSGAWAAQDVRPEKICFSKKGALKKWDQPTPLNKIEKQQHPIGQ